MNAADLRMAGAMACAAGVIVLVVVAVDEGYVSVQGPTQQTELSKPGSTSPIASFLARTWHDDDLDWVVNVAPLSAGDSPELRVAAGEDVVIHDMQPPTRVQIDASNVCKGTSHLVVNGVLTASDVLAFNRESVTYNVLCDGGDSTSGSITVVRDTLGQSLPLDPPLKEIRIDGDAIKVNYVQTIPTLEVYGGPGTLHVAHGTIEKTYIANGDSTLVPSADLEPAEYRFWFSPDRMSNVDIRIDPNTPMVMLVPLTWGPQLELGGVTIVGSTLSVNGVRLPIDEHGRFRATVPSRSNLLVLAIETPRSGKHYAIVREAEVARTNAFTMTQTPGGLDRARIMSTMSSLEWLVKGCAQAHPPTTRGIVRVNVDVAASGHVSNVDVVQGVEIELDICIDQIVRSATFPSSSGGASFEFPIAVAPVLSD